MGEICLSLNTLLTRTEYRPCEEWKSGCLTRLWKLLNRQGVTNNYTLELMD